ncbi:phosphopantetheine-binding protein [Streptomyces sp. NPDC000594]|uniref:phosphopantetheine-binding protein n=1 Tax=Streptomyces sp. NPDC000594 TaxID=3154261 RepID=UPI00331788FB
MADTAGQRSFTVERLTQDVAEVLYTEPGELPADENLLDLGLDSIRLMTLVEKWRAEGARIGFADLAERPTLTEWAGLLAPAGDRRADA